MLMNFCVELGRCGRSKSSEWQRDVDLKAYILSRDNLLVTRPDITLAGRHAFAFSIPTMNS